MRTGTTALACALLVLLPGIGSPRASGAEPPAGFRSLFNGEDLSGWRVEGGDTASWTVDDGVIVAHGRDYRTRNFLLTEREYSDFALRLEFQLEERTSSAVCLRGLEGERLPYIDRNFRYDHPMFKLIGTPGREETGTTYWLTGDDLGGVSIKPDRPAELKPPGSWNLLEIEVRGRSLHATVNGRPVRDISAAEGTRYADGSPPGLNRARGRIGLQKHTGTARFRNVAVRELVAEEAPAGVPAGFTPLFNGRDLDGWRVERGDPEAWAVEGGAIVARGRDYRTRDFLLSDAEYSDFALRLEFDLDRGVCSGIGLRARPGEELPYPNGVFRFDHPMFKLIETPGPEETGTTYWLTGDDLGGVSIKPDRPAELKPPGSWNLLEIEVRGRSLHATVNGKPVRDLAGAEGARYENGTLPGLNRAGGRIALQKHTGTARFRNVAIRDLAGAPARSLYVLAIGINQYRDRRLALDCAAPDARLLREAFLTHSRRLFPGGVQARLLLDSQATRANILDGLRWLRGAKAGDVAVLFYAGHGDSKIEGEFYIVPADADLRDLAATGISGRALKQAAGALPCSTILILDACESGGFDAGKRAARKTRSLATPTDALLGQLVYDAGVVVMCGAARDQEAAEEDGHGFFTRAIVEGLAGKADVFKKGRVELYDLQAYVKTRVSELSANDQEPTISIPSTVRSFSLSQP